MFRQVIGGVLKGVLNSYLVVFLVGIGVHIECVNYIQRLSNLHFNKFLTVAM